MSQGIHFAIKNYDNQFSFGVRPLVDWANINFNFGQTRNVDNQAARTNETDNWGVNVDLQLPYNFSTTNSLSYTKSDDSNDLAENTAYTYSTQLSYQFEFPNFRGGKSPGQVFARYDYQDNENIDNQFDTDTIARSWVVTTGITASLF